MGFSRKNCKILKTTSNRKYSFYIFNQSDPTNKKQTTEIPFSLFLLWTDWDQSTGRVGKPIPCCRIKLVSWEEG